MCAFLLPEGGKGVGNRGGGVLISKILMKEHTLDNEKLL